MESGYQQLGSGFTVPEVVWVSLYWLVANQLRFNGERFDR
ncbi:hypothetical protein C8D92_106112 [Tamilnaduibacter salinus]|uniref:Uncharacterized protein n=1 Tax=Tamilnaduibacter salinus TaxID=1484056 RepID=A0A2U1CVR3_9GAMM|nr:hypothetical protein C8D92_106112 [Tamilnaduibacter salinus]